MTNLSLGNRKQRRDEMICQKIVSINRDFCSEVKILRLKLLSVFVF